jgi:hypothetical protein
VRNLPTVSVAALTSELYKVPKRAPLHGLRRYGFACAASSSPDEDLEKFALVGITIGAYRSAGYVFSRFPRLPLPTPAVQFTNETDSPPPTT